MNDGVGGGGAKPAMKPAQYEEQRSLLCVNYWRVAWGEKKTGWKCWECAWRRRGQNKEGLSLKWVGLSGFATEI